MFFSYYQVTIYLNAVKFLDCSGEKFYSTHYMKEQKPLYVNYEYI